MMTQKTHARTLLRVPTWMMMMMMLLLIVVVRADELGGDQARVVDDAAAVVAPPAHEDSPLALSPPLVVQIPPAPASVAAAVPSTDHEGVLVPPPPSPHSPASPHDSSDHDRDQDHNLDTPHAAEHGPRTVHVRHGDHEHVLTAFDGDTLIAHGSHFHTLNENLRNSNFILGVFILVLGVSQLALFLWSTFHRRTYDMASLFGLWIVPAFMSLTSGYVRMMLVWLIYSCLTALVIRLAVSPSQHVDRRTPRRIYQWFYALYYLCYGVTLAGYSMIMSDALAFSFVLFGGPLAGHGMLLMFYGLYYGVLSRDLCTFCAESMAVSIGYVAKDGSMPRKSLPENTCALCDHPLFAAVTRTDPSSAHGGHGGGTGGGIGGGIGSSSSVRLAAAVPASARAAAASAASSKHSAASVLDSEALVHAASQAAAAAAAELESVMQLPCTHQFHEFCLRGWSLIGKRDTCPYCREKAQLRKLFGNPWRSQSMMWSKLLDAMRYLIVYVPFFLLVGQQVLYWVY